ncbi:alpha/beta hydrolase fold domain-containing protein [Agrilactobacillus fermenti]|uniref:alpha/beta hydrolase fold domain-containing protein n=1 Tax=Agrilactobacillus fermenti TaxID=2586909 RepID=UPI003A5C1B9E
MQYISIPDQQHRRVTLIPEITYQNEAYWFGQTRRDWRMSLLLPFDYNQQQQRHPVVIWLSGGSWQMSDRSAYLPELTYLARAGYVVASIDYHMGMEGTFPIQIRDVRRAINYLTEQQSVYHLDMQAITLMGDSAGGHLALMTGYTSQEKTLMTLDLPPIPKIQNVVAYYAPSDLVALWEGYQQRVPQAAQFMYSAPLKNLLGVMAFDAAKFQAASPINYVSDQVPATLLLQGDRDHWVPLDQSKRLYQRLQAEKIRSELLILKAGNHIDSRFFAPAVKTRVLDFIQNTVQ